MSANAYGTIGVCGGYEGDLKRIVDILNDWRGEDESNYFVEDGVISINASEDEYPDIWPRYQWFVSVKDGRRVRLEDLDEPINDDEWEWDDPEEVPMQTISRAISPYLHRGAIEIFTVSYAEYHEGCFAKLTIRADGVVDWLAYVFAEGSSKRYAQSFDPSSGLILVTSSGGGREMYLNN